MRYNGDYNIREQSLWQSTGRPREWRVCMSKDLGDFQTPPALVNAVLHCLTRTGQRWTRALEPTCGQGNFIRGLLELELPPREVWGIELQHNYVLQAQNTVQQAHF